MKAAQEHKMEHFHSLGKCEHNRDISPSRGRENGWQRNHEIYSNYKFVLVMENSKEDGYVTEKLVTALMAGAIPVFYGDSRHARQIFNIHSFIDIHELWSDRKMGNDEEPSLEDWRLAAASVLRIIQTPQLHHKYIESNIFARAHSEPKVFPPECLNATDEEIDELYRSGWLKDFLQRVRSYISNEANV